MRILYTLLLSILLFSCGAAVTIDYDSEVDFLKYRTFDFYPDIDSGLSKLDDARIVRITDSLMQQRGFVRSESPQLLINFYAEETISNSRSTIGVGVGQSTGNMNVGVSGNIPIGGRTINQLLTVDFVDAKRDRLIWTAEINGELKERFTFEERNGYYLFVIKKMLAKYPPEE